jgi:zinc protease
MPGNGPNPVVKVPAFWTETLSNGVKMIGTESRELPVVTLSIQIPGGHILQAKDTAKSGLARMVGLMLNEDTKNYTAEQMQVELQKLGSSVNVRSGFDGITFTIQTLKKNLNRTLELLKERMLNPKFTEEAFSRIQKQTLEGFKQRKSRPATIASDVYDKLNYGNGNILGLNEVGTEYTVKNLKLENVENYYNQYMTSRGAELVVVGDVSKTEIIGKLGFLKELPAKDVKLPGISPAPAINKTRLYLVHVPKAAQTEFRVGYVTDLKYDATGEYYRTILMNYVLGGAFNSRINLNLREDKGWTYGARCGFSGDKYTGAFTFSSGIRANATDSALVEVMKELDTYAKKGITDEELKFMKSALGQRDALLYETGFQKAGFVRRILEYSLPADFVDVQNKILAEMKKEEINKLAAKWINTGKMNILLVGDKEKILPGLQKLGYEIIELDPNGNTIGVVN